MAPRTLEREKQESEMKAIKKYCSGMLILQSIILLHMVINSEPSVVTVMSYKSILFISNFVSRAFLWKCAILVSTV